MATGDAETGPAKGAMTGRVVSGAIGVAGVLALAVAAQEFASERQNYERALRECVSADAEVARSAMTESPESAMERTRAAEAKRAAAESAKSAWYEAVRRRYAPLANEQPGARADAGSAAAAANETLADFTTDANLLAQELKNISPVAIRRIAALRQQRSSLEELRKLYAERKAALERIAAANTAIDRARVSIAGSTGRALSLLAAEQQRMEGSRADWSGWYGAVRKGAEQRAALAAAAAAAAAKPPVAEPTPQPVQERPRSLVGTWTLVSPRLEKFADEVGPLYGDVSVQVEITQAGDEVAGSYRGVVFVPPNERYNPDVSFRFTAPVGTGAAVEGKIAGPLSGWVRIEWAGENEILVSYSIEKTLAAGRISFKQGGVKTLRRATEGSR